MKPYSGLWLWVATLLACGDGDYLRPRDARERIDGGGPEPDAEAAREAAAPTLPGLSRNIIVFMGDGMGPEQLATGRYAKPEGLRIERALSGPALVNTDSLTTLAASIPELEPTDSAAAASVIATGVRVVNEALSMTTSGEPLESVLEVCKRAGKATGLVTTSFFFDASPAAFAVHQRSRSESADIVRQMLTETQPDVIMGNGAWVFDPALFDVPNPRDYGYFVVLDPVGLAAWDPRAQPRLLGLFSTDFQASTLASEEFSMTPALERRADSPDPTLAQMTARALARLADDPDGFFLFAEDELIDEMGHRGPAEVAWANRAYPQQVAALDDAVGVAIDWVEAHSSFEETLIVVLADHETGGYRFDHQLGPSSGSFSAFSEGTDYPIGNHTRTPTAVYARGPGSEALSELREHADTHSLLLGEWPSR